MSGNLLRSLRNLVFTHVQLWIHWLFGGVRPEWCGAYRKPIAACPALFSGVERLLATERAASLGQGPPGVARSRMPPRVCLYHYILFVNAPISFEMQPFGFWARIANSAS